VHILSAQKNNITEFKKITQAYYSAENLSMEVMVTIYKDKNDKTGTLLSTGWMKKSGTNYYSSFDKKEFLSNSNGIFIIDDREKSIQYYHRNNNLAEKMSQMPNVDSLMALSDSSVFKGEEDNAKHYCFYNSESYIFKTEMYVDKTTNFVNKIIYHYKEAAEDESTEMDRVCIVYKNINQDKIEEHIFSEKKYVTIESGKVQATEAYKKYKLILPENE
jgi:mannose-1-phosphate guanylyltransferase